MRKLLSLLLTIAAAIAVTAALAGSASAAGGTVTVKDNFFSPKAKTISKGSKVTWKFAGKVKHNVTFKTVHSPTKSSGTYSLTFKNKGTFRYSCTIHSGMTGTITVK